jgi:hypothetical protein
MESPNIGYLFDDPQRVSVENRCWTGLVALLPWVFIGFEPKSVEMARNMLEYQEHRAGSWKGKAISRGLLLKLFRQLVGELRKARDKWRVMYEDEHSKRRAAEERIKELELELKKNTR